MRFTCRGWQPRRVYLCLWLLGLHLSSERAVAALHRRPRLATANWVWRPPLCICLLLEVLLDLCLFARSPSMCTDFSFSPLHALQPPGKHRGVFLQGAGRLSCPWRWSFTKCVMLPASALSWCFCLHQFLLPGGNPPFNVEGCLWLCPAASIFKSISSYSF